MPAGLDRAVEEVAGIELEAGRVREHLERAAAARLRHARGEPRRPAEAEVVGVVVAARPHELRVGRADAFADGAGAAEIERRAFDGRAFAGGDEAFRDRDEAIREEFQTVAQDLAAAGEVEERMVRQVAERGGVRRRLEAEADLVTVRGHQVGHVHGQRARVVLLARGADIGEADAGGVAFADGLAGPDAAVEAGHAAVEVLAVVVARDLEGPAVDGEAAVGDPVRVAADGAAEVRVLLHVAAEVVVPQRHLRDDALAVRHAHRHERRAELADLRGEAETVAQRVQGHRPTFQLAVPTGLDARRAVAAAERDDEPGEQDQEGEDGEDDRKFHGPQGVIRGSPAKPKPPFPPNKKPAGGRVCGRAGRRLSATCSRSRRAWSRRPWRAGP
ncbi:aldose 1-epimerase [Opitutia bacterium]|nr:aldose 1-epimerase [Opitutae bacterium]